MIKQTEPTITHVDLFEITIDNDYPFIIQYNYQDKIWLAINDNEDEEETIIIESQDDLVEFDKINLFGKFVLTQADFKLMKEACNNITI